MKTNIRTTISVLDGKFLGYKGKVDDSYMCSEIKNYVINCCDTEYLYHRLVDNRRTPVHSIAWSALMECVNAELKIDNLICTSQQIKKWFTMHNLDYKKVLAPLISQLTEEREEMLAEKEN